MAALSLLLALVAGAFPSAAALRVDTDVAGILARSKTENLDAYSFAQFVRDFRKPYAEGSEEWATREAIFRTSIEAIQWANGANHAAVTWKMGLSKFLDFTDEEKKSVLGYKGRGSRNKESGVATAFDRGSRALPSTFSVTEGKRAKLLGSVMDQGNCGSCWAAAAVAVLEGQMEVNDTLMEEIEGLMPHDKKVPSVPTLSLQGVVSCTANKRHCGGTGGCGGATVELAYDMLKEYGGLPFAAEWSYSASTGECRQDVFKSHRIGITGYNVLPSNKLHPLQEALVNSGGPIAVSVDATNWFLYSEGVYSDFSGDFTVNHAVTLMGYKMPEEGKSQGWWRIKNSWGSYWGEKGHIRIEMKPHEESHCGWDRNTHDGLACDGDPDTAWVCGTCGILFDSVYPHGLHFVRR